jgi:hypothetical protein
VRRRTKIFGTQKRERKNKVRKLEERKQNRKKERKI